MENPEELRRSATPKGDAINLAYEASIDLGPLTIEPALRLIRHEGGAEEVLQPRIMQVLVALIRANGQILTRDALTASCWDGVVVGEDSINRVIGQLRRLSDGIGRGCFQVETITKVGYRLISASPTIGVSADARRSTSQAAGPRLSICVLPFANMSGDQEQEYFSDGISEDIITDLSKVSALAVASRNSAFRYKGQHVDLPKVARELGVSHVLEGSVRKAGGRVRITAQLIDGATNDPVWAERYDRDLIDIFAVQDEISQAIVEALKLKLLPEEKKAIEQRGTDNAEAYDVYLMARQHWASGNEGDPRQSEAIIRLCRRVVEIDPGYAQAWALMASGQYTLQRRYGRPGDRGQASLDRALALKPDLAEARSLEARMLSDAGRREEAAAEIAVALRLDPESNEVNTRAGFISFRLGRLEDAAHHFEKVIERTETDLKAISMLVSCYTHLGDGENTRRAATLALEGAEKVVAQDRNNGFARAVGVTALAALGEKERARDWMNRALLIDPDNLQMRYKFACTLVSWLNDADAALNILGAVLEQDPGDLLQDIWNDPDLAGLRDDPRFQAMIAAGEARLAAG
jgi:adenylate cyclase